jgi:precorrin-6B methylase 1
MPKKKITSKEPKKIAAVLRKRGNATKRRAKAGEDASQAAARILREATQD